MAWGAGGSLENHEGPVGASENLDSAFGEKLAPDVGPTFPRTASKDEIEAAKEALRRRRLRGEGYGETSVPRGEP
jgi:hypothetical protein